MAATSIPLTTTFTPPTDCLASITYSGGNLLLGADTSCRPAGAGTYGNTQFFSPGLICPRGWTSAAATTVTAGSVTETRATCCPSLGQISFSGERLMYAVASSSFGCTAWIYAPITALVSSVSTRYTTTITNYTSPTYTTVRARGVHIAWQPSDLLLSRSSSSAEPTTVVTTSSSPANTTSSPAATESDSPDGLSTAAKISMGVVIPIVVLAALALGFFIIRRRKSKTRSPTREIQQEVIQDGPTSQIESTTNDKYGTPPIAYTQLQRGHRDEYDERQSWSQGDHGSMNRTPELPSYVQPNVRSSR